MWRSDLPPAHEILVGVKRKTFYHISLSLPYLALMAAGAVTYFGNGSDILSSPSPPDLFIGTMMAFSISAAVWGPLYTWMVVALLFWSRGKDADQVRQLYLFSPLLLACSMGIPTLLLGIPNSIVFLLSGFLHLNNMDFVIPILFRNFDREGALVLGMAWLFMAAVCIVVGYAFVGIVVWMERVMTKKGKFKDVLEKPL